MAEGQAIKNGRSHKESARYYLNYLNPALVTAALKQARGGKHKHQHLDNSQDRVGLVTLLKKDGYNAHIAHYGDA